MIELNHGNLYINPFHVSCIKCHGEDCTAVMVDGERHRVYMPAKDLAKIIKQEKRIENNLPI